MPNIEAYTCRCECERALCPAEMKEIDDCIRLIARELDHSFDRHTGTIIASQIGLLLNCCTRICRNN